MKSIRYNILVCLNKGGSLSFEELPITYKIVVGFG